MPTVQTKRVASILKMTKQEREESPNISPVVGIIDRPSHNGAPVWVVWAGRSRRVYKANNLVRITTLRSVSIVIVPSIEQARIAGNTVAKKFGASFVGVLEPDAKGFVKDVPEPVTKKPSNYTAKDVLKAAIRLGLLDGNPELLGMARNVL